MKLWLVRTLKKRTLILSIGLLFVFLACGHPSPIIDDPEVFDPLPPVAPGAEVSLGIEVTSADPVSYEWISDERGGTFISDVTSAGAVWKAPYTTGTYNIQVRVTIKGETTEKPMAIKVLPVAVAAAIPTETPTAISQKPTQTATRVIISTAEGSIDTATSDPLPPDNSSTESTVKPSAPPTTHVPQEHELTFNQTISGTISVAAETDPYRFEAKEGDTVLIGMSGVAGKMWQRIDLYDPAGNLLESDKGPSHAEITLSLPGTGSYTILTRDGFNDAGSGDYSLHLQKLP